MTYDEAITYLYSALPAFERNGASDYKPGLERIKALDRAMGRPSQSVPAIHIAGTNGKGTTAHALAAVLHAAGLKTGLFTSPHLTDFSERIRVNGQMIGREAVAQLTEEMLACPGVRGAGTTFFEFTTVMAFEWFRRCGCDVMVIETGLGGRLDSTNIIKPVLSIITNIGLDHTDMLGDTLPKIAYEKGGIIKPGIPCVVSRYPDAECREVFRVIASERGSKLTFAQEIPLWGSSRTSPDGAITLLETPWGDVSTQLRGDFQLDNLAGILSALQQLPWKVSNSDLNLGLGDGLRAMGLYGRWSVIGREPLTVVDTGHNPDAWKRLSAELSRCPGTLHLVLGFVADKDVDSIIRYIKGIEKPMLLYLTAPKGSHRALDPEQLRDKFGKEMSATLHPDVNVALAAALAAATTADTVFVGGSNYLVGELR